MRDKGDVKKLVSYEYIIERIINALTHPDELYTDGECMDEVWCLLESKGYDVKAAQKERQEYLDNNGLKKYKQRYI